MALPTRSLPVRSSLPVRRSIGLVAAALMALALVGCSSGDGDVDTPARATTTSSAEAADATTTSAAEADRTTTTGTPATSEPEGPVDPTRYRGTVDGQGPSVEVSFRIDSDIVDFEVSNLAIECQPLTSGEPTTRTVTVALPRVPIAANGMVEYVDQEVLYRPSITGSFTRTGSFAGSLFLSGEDDGFVCGGEFSFLAERAR